MADKKAYALRLDAELMAALQRWAEDELRSVNAQIEYVLRDALRRAGRVRQKEEEEAGPVSPPHSPQPR